MSKLQKILIGISIKKIATKIKTNTDKIKCNEHILHLPVSKNEHLFTECVSDMKNVSLHH